MLTRFILIQTSHDQPGNVGACARAMKPWVLTTWSWWPPLGQCVAPRGNHPARQWRPGRAGEVRIVDTLDEALDGLTHLCATAMTRATFGRPP